MKANIKVVREIYTNKSTIGKLYINDKFICYTLEDIVRAPGVKVKGETAIPAGTYKMIFNMSNRFKKVLPLLMNVPMFEGIRIHTGNKAEDSEGCLLLGMIAVQDEIRSSKIAYNYFEKELEGFKEFEVTIVNTKLS